MKRGYRPHATISIDPDVLASAGKKSRALGISQSRLIENCLIMALDDPVLIKKLGLLEVVKLLKGDRKR
jgi:hypothetical protein